MIVEEIVAAILAKHSELSEQQIQEMLVCERERSGGLIGDETLLRLIAAMHGVEVSSQAEFSRILSSGRLVSGLNDVSVEGKIVAVFFVRSFGGGGEKSGKFANLAIVDDDSILRVVLWNNKAEVVERGELRIGQVVKFLHGYTREDQFGNIELHLGVKGKIEINEGLLVSDGSYFGVEKFASKICDISDTFSNVHLVGVVKEVFESKTFTKGDNTEGKFMRFALSDGSADISVVIWNGKVDVLERQLKPKVRLYLINGKVKEKEGGGFEIHVDASSFVHVQSCDVQMSRIIDLKENEIVNVEGKVSNVDSIKEVTTGKGEQIKLLTFELKDTTGTVKISVWRNRVEQFNSLKLGDTVVVENGVVKKGWGGKLELTTRSETQFTVKTT
ncbi:MAG: hypothetical protein LBE76_00200 [Nitrososphaerota archaeon]|jgi:replication factor A1|nr:hypothetical protein [Nitrososphaerota archaeon]